MFGGAKKRQAKPRHGATSLSSLGLMDVPGTDELGNMTLDEGGQDDELEAELNAIIHGENNTKKPIKKKKEVSSSELQSMVDLCMQEISSEEENADDDLDDNDTDLLNELAGLGEDGVNPKEPQNDIPSVAMLPETSKVNVERQPCDQKLPCAGASMRSTIDARISMYTTAKANADAAGESSKSRRFARGLATLNEMKQNVNNGKAIQEDDIPPPLASTSTTPTVSTIAPPESSLAPSLSDVTEQNVILKQSVEPILNQQIDHKQPVDHHQPVLDAQIQKQGQLRDNSSLQMGNNKLVNDVKLHRQRYRAFALQSKSNGHKDNAVWGLKAVKLCDMLISKLEKGESTDFDLSTLPDLPTCEVNQEKQLSDTQPPTPQKLQRTFSRDDPIQIPDNPEDIPPPGPSVFGAPPPPTSVGEALNQRLAKYREDEAKAKEEGNASKARRLGRICKQYQDALKLNEKGKPIPIAELPTPPGFAPIPNSDINTNSVAVTNVKQPVTNASLENKIADVAKPETNADTANRSDSRKTISKQRSMTIQEKQLALLVKRQALFKSAALEAKRAGQIEQAKEYLRSSKGFDKLIDASRGGLPVDISTLPVPPQSMTNVDMGFTLISKEDGMHISENLDNKSRQEMYLKLEADIKSQINMCEANQKHFKLTSDIASANKFQQMSEHTKKDLDALRFAYKRGDPVPKFHYEVRAFSIIVCNSDLTDHEMEVMLERGINYNVANPKEVDTYCRIEFPYPKETPFKDKTATVKNTNNPEYNHKIMIPVNIKEKACQRVFKRGVAKVEVWSKGGFLRGDTLLGTASVKLASLETACTLHDTFPLMDGRKAVGGKVEVQIKLRNAIVTKQVEKKEEKWLVISFR